MKKKQLRAAWRMLAGVAILTSMVPVRAQVPNDPSAWPEFLKDKRTPHVIDTFRMQTFSQSVKDNWNYTTEGGASLSEEAHALKIPMGGKVSMEPYSLLESQKVSAIITFSVHSLAKGEQLLVDLDNKKGHIQGESVYTPGTSSAKSIKLGSNPYLLNFYTSEPASNTQNGYFLIDSIYAYDTIPRYSLFSGKGKWNDAEHWSYLPPYRRRRALINGTVEINTKEQCNQVNLKGNLLIEKNGSLTTDSLFLHGTDNTLGIDGELTVNKQVTIYYTFPSKGKWYFVSFPFNVRPAGLDKRFQWEDASFSGSGNYLYVQVYDSEKRAINNKATGNWTVLSPTSFSGNFLFEKGKGYLIALDAAADDNTLAFSVDADDLPGDFGKTTSIPVSAASATNDTHSGWYLCGNPLPAPLSLSQIAADPLLDGNIYLYEESKYKAYPIGSNLVLPPFSAFFVKAKADLNLQVTAGAVSANAIRLKTDYALRTAEAEPEKHSASNSLWQNETKKSDIKGKTLYLNGLPAAGMVQVSNYLGKIVYKRSIPSGTSVIPLPLPAGFYIVTVKADNYCAQHKCILAQ